MRFKIFLLALTCSLNILFAQEIVRYYSDAFMQQPTATQASTKVTSINLTGNFHELVIAIGFPDRNPYYPRLYANSDYPLIGVFANGTLLKDYVDQQGGSIPIDAWYKPAFDAYFITQSNGLYNVDFKFVKKPNGTPYTTTNTFSYFRNLNGSDVNVIYNHLYSIVSETLRNIYADSSNIFTGISAVHCIFNVQGETLTTKSEFWAEHGGTIDNIVTIRNSLNQIIYSGPISYQWNPDPVIHERMHLMGVISDYPSDFAGFPDRGYDALIQQGHGNLTGNYDVMYHNGNVIPDQYSLYGLLPINTHDLMFLGWIASDEILTIRNQNLTGVKLADVNNTLTSQQKSNGFYRVAKIMLHENYDGDWDEYLLIEFHNATGFDKNFTNYDEPSNNKYNKGLLIWHIKETTNLLGQGSDNMIDVVPAVPYNGYYSNPVPNDSYPGHNPYNRSNYNGMSSGENDYLDDLKETLVTYPDIYNFDYMPDGGRHIWETTTTAYRPYTWYNYPSGTNWFYRTMSMKSDLFTDATVNGRVNNKITGNTTPSTKDWSGSQSYLSITNVQRVSDYMTFDIQYNVLSGTLSQNTTIDGVALLSADLIVPSGITLTIKSGSNVNLNNYSIISTGGTITKESNVTFNTLVAYLKDGTTIKGYCGSIQSACNNTTSGGTIYTVEILSGTYTENISVDGKRLAIHGQGIGSTTINGDISISNSGYIVVQYLTCHNVYFYNCEDPYTRLISITNSDSFSAVNSPVVDLRMTVDNSSDTYACSLSGSSGSIDYQSHFSGNTRAVQLTDYTSATIDGTTFCSNTYDIYADGTSSATAGYGTYNNTYSGNPPTTKFYGYVDYNTSNYSLCLSKAMAQNERINNIASKDPAYDEFVKIRDPYFELTRKVRNDISANGDFIKTKFSADYTNAISNFKSFIKNNPNSSLSKTALLLTASCYKKQSDYEGLKTYLQDASQNSNLTGMANRLMMDYYTNQKDYAASLTLADKIVESAKTDTSLICDALFAKGFIYQNYLDKKDEAITTYSNLLNSYPNNSFTSILKHQLKTLGKTVAEDEKIVNTKQTETVTLESSNYPNPFNPSTTISYTLPEDGKVSLKVFDVLGREVTMLVNQVASKGKHSVVWDGTNYASGIYFYSITFKGETINKKMLLVK
jgi:tetratricopeptide (TPR) repeat protein